MQVRSPSKAEGSLFASPGKVWINATNHQSKGLNLDRSKRFRSCSEQPCLYTMAASLNALEKPASVDKPLGGFCPRCGLQTRSCMIVGLSGLTQKAQPILDGLKRFVRFSSLAAWRFRTNSKHIGISDSLNISGSLNQFVGDRQDVATNRLYSCRPP